MMICGVDEAGRGPVLGPLVVAGVCVEDDAFLRDLRVRDSKKCTPERRERLSKEILKTCTCEIIVVPAEDIDRMRDNMTLNEIEGELFASVIERLRPDKVYVDAADANEETFRRMIEQKLSFSVEIVSKHGADDLYPVVSAASIIAKTVRDKEVRRIEKELGVPVGSGYPSDEVSVRFLEWWVSEKGELPPYVRKSWKTAERILSRAKTKSLYDFTED